MFRRFYWTSLDSILKLKSWQILALKRNQMLRKKKTLKQKTDVLLFQTSL